MSVCNEFTIYLTMKKYRKKGKKEKRKSERERGTSKRRSNVNSGDDQWEKRRREGNKGRRERELK